jgi:hypothetical protein
VAAPQTALVDDVTELLILWPHLAAALERDNGTPEGERVSGDPGTFGLPLNADVLQALQLLTDEVPKAAAWAAGIIAEPPMRRTIDGHLRHFPRLHERMLVTAAIREAAELARTVHAVTRRVKLALGLRTVDRRLGQFCPLHDDPLSELIAPGDEGILRYRRLDQKGQPIAPAVEWRRFDCALCRHCKASWAPSQYLLLGKLLREADARRLAAEIPAEEGAA